MRHQPAWPHTQPSQPYWECSDWWWSHPTTQSHIHEDTGKIWIYIFTCWKCNGSLYHIFSFSFSPVFSIDLLTQLFLRGPFFQEGDSLQDGPEHHAKGEDVRLGRVGHSTPHLRSHVEVRATGGGEVLPRWLTVHQTFAHLAQTKVCHLQVIEKEIQHALCWHKTFSS